MISPSAIIRDHWVNQNASLGFLTPWFFFLINDFMYSWLCCIWIVVFVSVHGISLVAMSRVYPSLQCEGFSLRWLLLQWSMGPGARGLCSCGSQSPLPRSTWDLPGPGIEPVSPVSAGRFLSTGPSGKSRILKAFLKNWTPEGPALTRWSRATCWT